MRFAQFVFIKKKIDRAQKERTALDKKSKKGEVIGRVMCKVQCSAVPTAQFPAAIGGQESTRGVKVSQSGGRSGAVQRFSESHAICARRLSAPVRTRLIALLSPPSLPSFYLFRSLSPSATSIQRSCPYMALANVWPGRHKVIAEGFSLVCSCASCTTAQTGPL